MKKDDEKHLSETLKIIEIEQEYFNTEPNKYSFPYFLVSAMFAGVAASIYFFWREAEAFDFLMLLIILFVMTVLQIINSKQIHDLRSRAYKVIKYYKNLDNE